MVNNSGYFFICCLFIVILAEIVIINMELNASMEKAETRDSDIKCPWESNTMHSTSFSTSFGDSLKYSPRTVYQVQ